MNKRRHSTKRGITLIETIIFASLLSILVINFISFSYGIYTRASRLIREIWHEQGGFIATTTMIMIALSTLAFCLSVLSASVMYADSIDREVVRVQKSLREEACLLSTSIVSAKGYRIDLESYYWDDLGCIID